MAIKYSWIKRITCVSQEELVNLILFKCMLEVIIKVATRHFERFVIIQQVNMILWKWSHISNLLEFFEVVTYAVEKGKPGDVLRFPECIR